MHPNYSPYRSILKHNACCVLMDMNNVTTRAPMRTSHTHITIIAQNSQYTVPMTADWLELRGERLKIIKKMNARSKKCSVLSMKLDVVRRLHVINLENIWVLTVSIIYYWSWLRIERWNKFVKSYREELILRVSLDQPSDEETFRNTN